MSRYGHDVIAAEVHRKALENITNEMAIALVRTSGSPVVTDTKDFVTCIMDTTPEHLGFAAFVLLHAGTSLIGTRVVADIANAMGGPHPGDGWVVNDPHTGGAAHQGDVAVIMPMFHGSAHIGWGFVNIHVVDIGGAGSQGIAPMVHDVFGEGILLNGVRVIRDGVLDPEWQRFLAANVRAPGPVLNDLRSMISALNVGNRKLSEVIDRVGIDRHQEFCEINKDLTELVIRERIRSIPDGIYKSVEWVEYDGHGGPDRLLEVRLELEVSHSDLYFRFAGDPQIDAYINAGIGAIWGHVATGILTKLAYADLPVNGGFWRPLAVDVGKPGTIVNPIMPAPVSAGHAVLGMRVTRLVQDALSQALSLSDDRVLRGRVAGKSHEGPTFNAFYGSKEDGAVAIVFYADTCVGNGGGAQTVHDGQDSYGMACMTGCGLVDIEGHEATDPVEFLWRRVVSDSGGPGQFRGGSGMEQAFQVVGAGQLAGPSFLPCAQVPASGFGGGFPGSGGRRQVLRNANADVLKAAGKLPVPGRLRGTGERLRGIEDTLVLRPGDVLISAGGGGGGIGDPLLRPPETVARDVQAGYITAYHASAAYGVVLSENGTADLEATACRRDEIRRRRIGRTPTRPLAPPDDIGIAVVAAPDLGEWACGSCGHSLGGIVASWRDETICVEGEIGSRLAELGMSVDSREEPQVLLREFYCPTCAHALTVDVVAGAPSTRSHRKAAAGAVDSPLE